MIERLRREFPGVWRYKGLSRWARADGFVVQGYSVLAPRFDGDDDHFVTVYRREDTGESIHLW